MKESLQRGASFRQYDKGLNQVSHASRIVEERLSALDIEQNEKLGQHFLIDDNTLNKMAQEVESGANVIEIGAGVGQLTELLALHANKVTSIEIDRRYEEVLRQLQERCPNVEIVYGDALSIKLGHLVHKLEAGEHTVQIVANLPYHITEPFMHLVAELRIPMSLMVGEKFAQASLAGDPNDPNFTTLSMLCQSFFEIDRVLDVPREAFLPEPRTKSAIMRFTPKGEAKQLSRADFVTQQLFISMNKSPLVKNVIKEALIKYSEVSLYGTRTKTESSRFSRRTTKQELRQTLKQYQFGTDDEESGDISDEAGMTQNQARGIIQKLGAPDSILGKPFSQLNNSEIRVLAMSLR